MLEQIFDRYPEEEFLIADGFDEAVIGVDDSTMNAPMRLIYSVTKAIEILMAEGLTEEDAWEHFDYNVQGSYMGEKTPIWCYDDFW